VFSFPERQLIVTADGSHTFALKGIEEHYHSVFGALQESRHVYIENGLKKILEYQDSAKVLEIGFGTGLNALLTFMEGQALNASIIYHTLEPYPLNSQEYSTLNYPQLLGGKDTDQVFLKLHESPWNKETAISKGFLFRKLPVPLLDAKLSSGYYDLVYYDAFGPEVQPEMWEMAMFKKMHAALRTGGVLTTYCSKGGVRRGLKQTGFYVSKMPGPAGKRDITYAQKLS